MALNRGDSGGSGGMEDLAREAVKSFREAIEKSKEAMAEAFADPNAPPVLSEAALRYPPDLQGYVQTVLTEAATWEKQLKERFGKAIEYEIDLPGFTGEPERNAFALIQLKEVGVDWVFWAVTNLAEKDAAIANLVRQRLRTLRIVHVATATEKSLTADGNALVLRLALHKDYSGYLTMPEMTAVLPGLLGAMAEVPREVLVAHWKKLEPAKEKKPKVPAVDPALFAGARRDAEGTLKNCAGQLEALIGRRVALELDWRAVGKNAERVWAALNAGLSPVLAGVALAAQDAGVKAEMARRVRKVLLRPVKGKAGFVMKGTTLVYQVTAGENVPGDAMGANRALKGLFALKVKKPVVVKRGRSISKSNKAREKPKSKVAREKAIKYCPYPSGP